MCSHNFSTLDPELWTQEHVKSWLHWATREYGLQEIDPGKFAGLEGKDLCRLTRDDFNRYTSPYSGEILLSHLNFLRSQCKFSCKYSWLIIRCTS